jgi:LuxR family maltose regulon positive regulatory protein
VLIAEGSDEALQGAEKEVQECLRLSQTQHNTFQMISIMALQVVVFQKQGRTDEALAVLEKVVDLARPGEWIRPFIESGPTMEGLLMLLAEKNVALDYIGQLLKAFRDDQYGMQSEVMSTQTVDWAATNNQPLVSGLTPRELEIMNMLAQRLQNKEIAARLFIAPETVKKHLRNIYTKLKVTGRNQAVEKARILGNILRTGM